MSGYVDLHVSLHVAASDGAGSFPADSGWVGSEVDTGATLLVGRVNPFFENEKDYEIHVDILYPNSEVA
jgi:hypothetical protein